MDDADKRFAQAAPPDPAHADVTRATLLLRLRAGGEAREVAWQEFHDRYQPMIAGFAARQGAGRQDVDELVADVMQAFFRTEFRYDPTRGRFRGYLKTCVCNKLKDLRARRARDGRPGDGLAADEVAVESTWNDVWETEKLHRAVGLVRARYATNADRVRTFRAFEMCTLLDRAPEEVAAELGLSAEGVRAAKSRVSRALRETFERLDEVTG